VPAFGQAPAPVGVRREAIVRLPGCGAHGNQVFPVRKASVSCRSRVDILILRIRFGLVEERVQRSTNEREMGRTMKKTDLFCIAPTCYFLKARG
jgi:hypothetical protein